MSDKVSVKLLTSMGGGGEYYRRGDILAVRPEVAAAWEKADIATIVRGERETASIAPAETAAHQAPRPRGRR